MKKGITSNWDFQAFPSFILEISELSQLLSYEFKAFPSFILEITELAKLYPMNSKHF